ncbi:hypothetical protein B0H10DRAFT_1879518 [Mycena sp. CBHHK59/15]|nr:hypothetical protein B0H10DRAFT_1879518 [Mycena sp. CBHHK59/15]
MSTNNLAYNSELVPVGSEPKSEGTLRPTTSNDTRRYERTGLAEPDNMLISAGLFIWGLPEPAYLPRHWSAHIHPEGQLYFCREGSPRVVTEAHLYRRETLDNVTRWIEKIDQVVLDKSFPISDQIELFIKIDDAGCAYYFVDHATRTQCWLEEMDTYDLGLSPVVSVSQLNTVFEELYWSHVEHFPMHFGGLSREILDSLLCVLTHAICDQMTSRVSTFPYSKQECEAFVSLLKNSRDLSADGNITCTVARLWSLVCRNRYLTHYGQEYSRLSRDQAVLYAPEVKHPWVATLASRATFETSDRYLSQLDGVFVDNLVYTEQWKKMVSGCLRDWRGASHGAYLGLMLHIFLLALTSCPILVVGSASLFGASLLGSTLLIHRYEVLEGFCATQAMKYLESIQSPRFKFQFIALVFALPQALRLWGMCVLFVNCMFMVYAYFGTEIAAGILLAACVALLMFQWTTSERSNLCLAGLHEKFLRRTQDVSYTSLV